MHVVRPQQQILSFQTHGRTQQRLLLSRFDVNVWIAPHFSGVSDHLFFVWSDDFASHTHTFTVKLFCSQLCALCKSFDWLSRGDCFESAGV